MANLRNHTVIEVWQDKRNPDVTFHVTDNDRVLLVHKNARASAKLLFKTDNEVRLVNIVVNGFNFCGIGRRATATEYRERLEQRAVRK